jgi:hypothetical protein
MTATDLVKQVRKRPFVPFKMVVSEGGEYPVRHPDQVIVARDHVSVGIKKDPDQEYYDYTVFIDLLHVVRLEALPAGVPASGNGAGP